MTADNKIATEITKAMIEEQEELKLDKPSYKKRVPAQERHKNARRVAALKTYSRTDIGGKK